MKKIAIQGIRGSFHDIAAHQYFANEEVELVCCQRFEDIFTEMRKDNNCLGLMAIENTIAGSLLHNYELLRESGMTIVGEHKLHIEHSIMCLPNDDWDTITEVNSHPVALAQCRHFLSGKPDIKVVEAVDTAGAAEIISRKQMAGHAAICHADAAPLYGMKVLEQGIEDNKHNYTRFLVMSDPWGADALRNVTLKARYLRCSVFFHFITSISLKFSRCPSLVASGNICSMLTLPTPTTRATFKALMQCVR